ncbi:MAG: ABC transporter substrate binding protein, partial [Bacillota bacterium]
MINKRLFLIGMILLSTFTFAVSAETASEPKRILLLHSYHQGMQWTQEIEKGIKEMLEQELSDYRLYIEYMDSKRFDYQAMTEELNNIYHQKYKTTPPDIIITSDDNALNFILSHRPEIFPGIPVVFCGVNNLNKKKLATTKNITGIVEEPSIKETIQLMLDVHDDLTKIVVINDKTTTGRANRKKLEQVTPSLSAKVDFEYWQNFSMKELQGKLGTLKSNTAILLLSFNRDRLDHTFTYQESINELTPYTEVPIYGVWDFYLGQGIVGGKLISGSNQGRMAAELVVDAIEGNPTAINSAVTYNSNRYMFDYQQLQQFNIAQDQLPTESMIVNKPDSFYYKYKSQIWKISVLTALIVTAILAVFLVMMIKSNKEKEQAVKNAERANQTKREFLANMSHEIRTPINAIKGLLYLVLDTPLSLKQQNYLEKIQSSTDALLEIINDILDFSKIEAGKLDLEEEEFSLDEVLHDLSAKAAVKAYNKGLDF